ncbi:GtrA family protein [Tardiphaga sp. vice304]|uniref:GtrA family protein n=1 Tax=Tardiphaga sp. vice304 TaxID=2592817 RepID=UPI0011629A3F|nr:GtrA family protein [Tardiphaga sp. vice304]QDM28189.1 GtrA family protein [Tardiphaga sp. vice304]
MSREFIRFALAGGAAAAANILSRWLLSFFIRFEIAVVFAYLIGMAVAFVLTRHFVFARSDRQVHSEAMRFVLVNLVALVQVWIVSVGLAEWVLPWLGIVWQKDLIAHVVGVISPIATSYLGHKKFTFG